MTTLTDMMRRAREDDPGSMRELVRELTRRGHIDVDAVVEGALVGARELLWAEAKEAGADSVKFHMETDEDADEVMVRLVVSVPYPGRHRYHDEAWTLGEALDVKAVRAFVQKAITTTKRKHADAIASEERAAELERRRVASMTDEQRATRNQIESIQRANANHLGQLESQFWNAMYGADPATAGGEDLDRIAQLAGLTRGPGETDAALRARHEAAPPRHIEGLGANMIIIDDPVIERAGRSQERDAAWRDYHAEGGERPGGIGGSRGTWHRSPLVPDTFNTQTITPPTLEEWVRMTRDRLDADPPIPLPRYAPPTHPSFPCVLVVEDPDDT